MSDERENEIVAAAKAAKERTERAEAKKDASKWPLKAIGLGVGIGSAAVAAAMLYADHNKKD